MNSSFYETLNFVGLVDGIGLEMPGYQLVYLFWRQSYFPNGVSFEGFYLVLPTDRSQVKDFTKMVSNSSMEIYLGLNESKAYLLRECHK